jgi:hypothetical protein
MFDPRGQLFKISYRSWRRGLVVSSPNATEGTEGMGREIESRQGIGRVVAFN